MRRASSGSRGRYLRLVDQAYRDYLEAESRLSHRFRGHDTRDWEEWAAFATTAGADVPLDAERAWVTRERSSHRGIRERQALRHLVAGAADQAFLDEICELTGLERLELEYPVTARSLAGLRSLTRLTHLSIDSPRNVTDFAPLLDLPGLRTLLITNAKHLTDLDWLADATHLEVLGIEGSMWTAQRIPSLTPLAGLTGLRAFFAVSSRLDDHSLAPLAECPRLELLSCARMAPRDEFEQLHARRPDLVCTWFRPEAWS